MHLCWLVTLLHCRSEAQHPGKARQPLQPRLSETSPLLQPTCTAPSPTGLWMPKNQALEKPGSQHPTLSHFPSRDNIF